MRIHLLLSLLALAACHEEPAIVIKFEPADLAASRAATRGASVDAGPVAPRPTAVDAGHAPAALEQPKSGKKECKVAADCVVEPIDCCDCANGGKQRAVAKSGAMAAKGAREKRCKGAMCTMMLSLDPTCGKRADCQAGACVLVDKK